MNKYCSKLGIGTAQWGMSYGISNDYGQTTPSEALAILSSAKEAGIRLIDTASLYGNAEDTLGASDLEPFLVVTKTPRFTGNEITKKDAKILLNTLNDSLIKLNISSVYGLLIHDTGEILRRGGEYLVEALNELKQQKKVMKIGFSAYDSLQVHRVCEFFLPDIIQLPVNVFDQRLLLDGTIKQLHGHGVEIHARSVFLQGLLLMHPASIPLYFRPWINRIEFWHGLCAEMKTLPQIVALQWVCSIPEIAYALVGIQNVSQLNQLISSSSELPIEDLGLLATSENQLLDPRLWSIKKN